VTKPTVAALAGRTARALLIAFVVGLVAGAIFWLLAAPSPAPPLLGLTGLLGMVVGERLVRRIIAAAGRKASPASTIRALETARYDAMVASDVGSMRKLFDPRLRYTHSNGQTDTADSYLKKFESGYYVYLSVIHSTESVLISGDTAIVGGSMDATMTVAGVPKTLHNKTLAIWVKNGRDWRFLSYAPTVLPAQ
jgi:XapX domain-containing protein